MDTQVQSFDRLTSAQRAAAGGKGASLARLRQAGLPVPDGFVILPGAFVDDELTPTAWEEVRAQLERLREGDDSAAFAVRSSAAGEDSAEASFAGEFETVLNVRDDAGIRAAIRTVYQSRQNARVQAYSQARGVEPAGGTHRIAVVVQRLIDAESAGVLFTANPLDGNRSQAMINASWGLGEAIVGGLVTPDTLVIDKASGGVVSRRIADKQVMTVRLTSGTEEQPTPEELRRAPALSDAQATELTELGSRIEALYGRPMDVEWGLAGGEFAIVQARPITALPPEGQTGVAEPPAPTKWPLPAGCYTAMRNNIVEMMADPLSPLFATFGLAAVNRSMHRLIAESFGTPGLMPERIIIAVNGYAYYSGSWSMGQLAGILWRSVGIMKRMFRSPVERWLDEGRPRYVETVARWEQSAWRDLTSMELLEATRELAEAAIDAYGALVAGVIPAAWISEGLFTLAYNTMIKRRDDPSAPTFLMGFDSAPIKAEQSLYDLAQWAGARPALARYLRETPAAVVTTASENALAPANVDADNWNAWSERWNTHLGRYGHAIYDLDFANPAPADDPTPIMQTCQWFMSGDAVDPHARQAATEGRRKEAMEMTVGRLRGLRRKIFRRSVETAQRYAPLREDGLADVGLAYPLLRQMWRELGRRFAAAGALESPDDIFWLTGDDVRNLAGRLEQGEALDSQSEAIAERRAAWRSAHQLTPPMALFQMRLFGKTMRMSKGARSRRRETDVLKGVAASPGRVTGPARVVAGPADFALMQPGEVLVAALTTPAWTPLFARAVAVVTDIGGPLSHGSIVAREYGIPAVLGAGSATKRIRSGQIITVDGSAGTVSLA